MKLLGITLAIAGLTLFAEPASAGCDPECTDGQVCRYEAAGDKFYCADPPKGKGKVIRRGETEGGSGAQVRPGGAAAPRPAQVKGVDR